MPIRRFSCDQHTEHPPQNLSQHKLNHARRGRSLSEPRKSLASEKHLQGVDLAKHLPITNADRGKDMFMKGEGSRKQPSNTMELPHLTKKEVKKAVKVCFLENLPSEIFQDIMMHIVFQKTPLTNLVCLSSNMHQKTLMFSYDQVIRIMNIEQTTTRPPFLLKQSPIFKHAADLLIKLAVPMAYRRDTPVEHGREYSTFTTGELRRAIPVASCYPIFGDDDRVAQNDTRRALELLFHFAADARINGFDTRPVNSDLLIAASIFRNWAATDPIGFYRALQPWAKREAEGGNRLTEDAVFSLVRSYAKKEEFVPLPNYCLKTLPAEIGALRAMRDIELCGNQLSTLPSEIWNLPNLASIDIRGNASIRLPVQLKEGKRPIICYFKNTNDKTLPSALEDFREILN